MFAGTWSYWGNVEWWWRVCLGVEMVARWRRLSCEYGSREIERRICGWRGVMRGVGRVEDALFIRDCREGLDAAGQRNRTMVNGQICRDALSSENAIFKLWRCRGWTAKQGTARRVRTFWEAGGGTKVLCVGDDHWPMAPDLSLAHNRFPPICSFRKFSLLFPTIPFREIPLPLLQRYFPSPP
jgi:hypothetical protein